MSLPVATQSPITMKKNEIDFTSNVYDQQRIDLVEQGTRAHNYQQKLVGNVNELELIITLFKLLLRYCNRQNINNNPRWEKVQEGFIFDQRGWRLWDKIVNRDYPQHGSRTNQALRDEMIPKFLDEVVGKSQNATEIYEYLQRLN